MHARLSGAPFCLTRSANLEQTIGQSIEIFLLEITFYISQRLLRCTTFKVTFKISSQLSSLV